MKKQDFFNKMMGMALLTNMIERRSKNNSITKNAGALIKGQIPYWGTGRSRTHRTHVRAIKKAQRRRVHYKNLRG